MRVICIGAGNVATRLSLEMQRVGFEVLQIYSQTESSASALAAQLGCDWTVSMDQVRDDADLYIFSVKDQVLPALVSQLKPNEGLWVHTAGSMSMELFKGHARRYGVFYPLQTFSKGREVSFREIPFFIEAACPEDAQWLLQVASRLSSHARLLSSEQRKHLHLAAVFACNFTNHIYVLASKLLEEQGIPGNLLLPLIDETAAKIHKLSPLEAQTGPAVRYDENVINKHLAMLTDPTMKELYRLMSQSIHKEAMK